MTFSVYFPHLFAEIVQPRFACSQANCKQSLHIMHKKWVFHDTPLEFVQIVYRFASCAIGRHVTLLVVMPMQHKSENMVKSTVSVLFASFCTKELEPRWAAKWSNCMQSHALSINNEISMTNVKNAHCCSSSSLVLPLVCHGALYFRMNTLRKAKLFPWYKSLNSPECAQLSLVYCSVHETIAERLFLHYCVAFCSPYISGRKNTKNTLNMRFSVYFPYLWAELVPPRFGYP